MGVGGRRLRWYPDKGPFISQVLGNLHPLPLAGMSALICPRQQEIGGKGEESLLPIPHPRGYGGQGLPLPSSISLPADGE